ncbi:MAG: transcriptional regulator CynR [Anaerolineae bacterium]|nr:transcriptional regulator CynR [Anaerolineae bacterium]
MELRQLRYLLAIAEEANFTRASEKVFVSQSALSQQIQALEQEVGTVLLDRSKRGVRLTAAGEILYHHAQRMFLELEQAKVAMQELEGLQRGELRVGVVQTVNDYLMPALVTRFAEQYPQIRLLIDELSSDEIEIRLENGELQVGLSFVPVSNLNIESESLFEERLVLIVRDDHPLADQAIIPVQSLDKMPMVMLSNTFCTRRLWEENAQLASAQPQIVMEMNTVSSILAVVEKTGLATVLPKLTVAEKRFDHLVGLDLHNPTPSRQVGLLWHRENYLCSASRAFIAIAKQVSAAFTP